MFIPPDTCINSNCAVKCVRLFFLLQRCHSCLQGLLPAQHRLVPFVELVKKKILSSEGRNSGTDQEGRKALEKSRTTTLGRCRCSRRLGIRRQLPCNRRLLCQVQENGRTILEVSRVCSDSIHDRIGECMRRVDGGQVNDGISSAWSHKDGNTRRDSGSHRWQKQTKCQQRISLPGDCVVISGGLRRT